MSLDSFGDLRAAIAAHVHTRMGRYRHQFAGVGEEIGDLFDVAGPLLSRGKRLRAAFLAAGWRSFGGGPLQEVELRAGAGLELFQLAALVHDDLMDASLTRRGLPAAHRQFRDLHARRAMITQAEEFGAAGALLLGDLLLVASQAELQAALDLLPHTAAPSRLVVEEMMAEVTIGQYLDIYAQSVPWAEDPQIDLDRARRVICAKSARYSVEHPLTLGATMAGANETGQRAVREIGLPIGEAFQLRDDVLSVFGDPEVTGKPAGDDLREGKRTVLVTLALALANPAQAAALKANVGDPDLTDAGVDQVRGILHDTGALAQVERLIAERADTARAAIEALQVPSAQTALLHELAAAAISRNQ